MYGVKPRIFKRKQRRATVYYPIWWYVAPTIINTFVENYDFSGKTLIPFATSGGSGMGKTVEKLKSLCPNANWEKGKMLNRVSETELKKWLDTIL